MPSDASAGNDLPRLRRDQDLGDLTAIWPLPFAKAERRASRVVRRCFAIARADATPRPMFLDRFRIAERCMCGT
jgi:hypothetical protein